MFVWNRSKINEKEAGDGPFKKISLANYVKIGNSLETDFVKAYFGSTHTYAMNAFSTYFILKALI